MSNLEEKRAEFGMNVWNHADDPFQMSFDERPPLSDAEVAAIIKVVNVVLDEDTDTAAKLIRPSLLVDKILLRHCLQLVGLTRNKIIQDLKGAARAGIVNVNVPSSFERLPRTSAWDYAGPYLTKKLQTVFLGFAQRRQDLPAAVEALNQATWPGFIRQERAKRSGHEAEFRLAALHLACGLPFQPTEKAENPLCRDIIIGGVSFDLVVPSAASPSVCVKSTVHTSNIGQYGESKDDLEVEQARAMLDAKFNGGNRPVLLAFIDGVGFESNRAGLDGVLSKSDEFCQFRTIWKAIMISAGRTGKSFRFVLPTSSIDRHAAFMGRHLKSGAVEKCEGYERSGSEIEAGEALIIVP